MKILKSNISRAVKVTLVLLLLCGFIYPFVLTGITNVIFPHQSQGNLIMENGKAVGSKYVGQDFTKDYFMWARPSAVHYNTYKEENGKLVYNDGPEFEGISSGSDNYANSNPELKERVQKGINDFLARNPGVTVNEIPDDLLTASGSGLDPDISVASAEVQVKRIAKASGLSEDEIRDIINKNTTGKLMNVFGTEHVNVLGVNLDIAKEMNLIK